MLKLVNPVCTVCDKIHIYCVLQAFLILPFGWQSLTVRCAMAMSGRIRFPRREVEICRRLREFRRSIKWSQALFAKALGLTRDQVASLEYGRTPLRYHLGNKICFVFQINQRWLAVGKVPKDMYLVLPWNLNEEVLASAATLFSEVYDKHLSAFLDKVSDDMPEVVRAATYRELVFERSNASPPTTRDFLKGEVRSLRGTATSRILHTMWEWLNHVPDEKHDHFDRALQQFLADYVRKNSSLK